MSTINLKRFVTAQQDKYEIALNEIKNGKKESHWMWYIFPQLKGLGYSEMAMYYGIADFAEAEEYMNHPLLSKRLLEISGALLELESNDVKKIMGYPDYLKLHSSMTLFFLVTENEVFKKVLEKYYEGKMDTKTIKLL